MSNPFTDEIRWLMQGLAAQTKAEKRYVAEHPFHAPTNDEGIRAAIRVLEAAGRVDKDKAEAWLDAAHAGCPDYDVKDAIRALLAALPGGGA